MDSVKGVESSCPSDKVDLSRPIGERQSPDGQEEPKTDTKIVTKTGGRVHVPKTNS